MIEKEEWKVLLKGKLFSDRLDSESEAIEHIDQAVIEQYGKHKDFTYEKMTDEDLQKYKKLNKIW